eukprot:TRINITY_DN24777_c0_g2_i1.p1 TRINITY_DN24777_c0_g2~~TRINITY_DN24777_c0_g2_i1.p1  ORF type:complete len:398 (-),score=45.40 TRINITY_DN24777_c0_g2_i1:215-1408(-)
MPILAVRLGSSIGQGTSGVVYPLIAADSEDGLTKEVEVDQRTYDIVADQLLQITDRNYVLKEVNVVEHSKDIVLKEVELHSLCSKECNGVVGYVCSGALAGESSSYAVVMEACKGDLWDALVAVHDGALLRKSTSSVTGGNSRPGQTRRSLRPSLSSSSLAVPKASQRPSDEERIVWTQGLCETLRACHAMNVLHRDINPWNVLIAATQASKSVRELRLADFGLAVRLKNPETLLQGNEAEEAVDLDDSAIGSLYSAPELGDTYGLSADIFSLGITLLAIWSVNNASDPRGISSEDGLVSCVEAVKDAACKGSPPPNDVLHWLQGTLEESLRSLILRMVASNPTERPSAVEVCRSVELWLQARGSSKIEEAADKHDSSETVPKKCCFFWTPQRSVTE